jgi:hypothetical protein
MEIYINVDLEMNEVCIKNGVYNTYTYQCDSLDEVGEIVQEFINEYIKGE